MFKDDVNVTFGRKRLLLSVFGKPLLEASDMILKLSPILLEPGKGVVGLGKMMAQDGQHFLFGFDATRVSEIQINDISDLIEAETELLELVDFPQTSQGLLGVIVLAGAFTFAGGE
jgi:hypothetical protein